MKHSPGFKASVRNQNRPAFVRKHILSPRVRPACWLCSWAALNTCCYPGRSPVSAAAPHRTGWVGRAREADREVTWLLPSSRKLGPRTTWTSVSFAGTRRHPGSQRWFHLPGLPTWQAEVRRRNFTLSGMFSVASHDAWNP